MAETIRGINVKIGYETTGLQAALKDVNQAARDISSELRQVERLLKFNPGDTKLLAQQQELLAKQIDNAREKLDRLRAVEQQVREQFSKGEISEGQMRAFERELVKVESQLKHYEDKLKEVSAITSEFARRTKEAGEKLQSIGKKMADVGKDLSKKLTAPIAAIGTVATKSAIDFESAFASVRKTVDATEAEFAKLKQGIRDMAKEIPATAVEIAGVAEAAGQLGIANEYLLDFTRTMIDLGESTNMSSDTAATSLARLANITQMPQSEFDRLGSTIVALGNNLATTEAEIVNMGLRLAGAGKQVGMTEAEILSLAGALSSVGIAAEAGGSAFSKVLVNMQLAVETGGTALDNFASVAEISAEQFRQAFQENAAGALIAFINGLQSAEERGTSAIKVLDDIGITEVRMRDALLRAAGAGELFAESIVLGTQAWEENTALTQEAAQRYETTASKLAIMRNRLQDAAITFGEVLLPVITKVAEIVGGLAEKISQLDTRTKNIIVTVSAVAAVAGPLLTIGGKLITGIGKLGTAIAGLSAPVVAAVAAITAFATLAIEVYRNWEEAKNAIVNAWELLKAAASSLVTSIQLGFTKMKATVLEVIDSLLERLSILENLPFGIGEKFAGLGEKIGDAAERAWEEVAEFAQKAEENSERVATALSNTGVAFSDLGTAIANDVKGIISTIRGQTGVIEEETAEQVDIVEEGQEQQSAITFDANQYRVEITQEAEQEQTEIVAEEAEKRVQLREQFEQQWIDKLFRLTATELDILEKEKEEALKKAEELGADKTAIIEYYAKKEQEIRNKQREQEEKARQQELEQEKRAVEEKEKTRVAYEESWTKKLFQQTSTRLQQLEAEKKEALKKAEELGADKTAIIEYYAIEQQKIRDEQRRKEKEAEEQALREKEERALKEQEIIQKTADSWTDSYMKIVDSMVESGKSIGEVLKEIVIKVITALEKQVIATQMAELAKAWAQSWWDWTAVARALASIAASTAAFEGAKQLVRGLATGGIVTAPMLAVVGEGKDDEAVLPLNKNTLSALGQAIAAHMPQQQVVTQRPIEVRLEVGTLIADDYGLKKLERQLQRIRISENMRLGVSGT